MGWWSLTNCRRANRSLYCVRTPFLPPHCERVKDE